MCVSFDGRKKTLLNNETMPFSGGREMETKRVQALERIVLVSEVYNRKFCVLHGICAVVTQ